MKSLTVDKEIIRISDLSFKAVLVYVGWAGR